MLNLNNMIVTKKRSAIANFENNFHNFLDDLGNNYKGMGLVFGAASVLWQPTIYEIPTISIPMTALCIWPSTTIDFARYSFGSFLAATVAQEMFGGNILNSSINFVKQHYIGTAVGAMLGYYIYNLDYEPDVYLAGQSSEFYY